MLCPKITVTVANPASLGALVKPRLPLGEKVGHGLPDAVVLSAREGAIDRVFGLGKIFLPIGLYSRIGPIGAGDFRHGMSGVKRRELTGQVG